MGIQKNRAFRMVSLVLALLVLLLPQTGAVEAVEPTQASAAGPTSAVYQACQTIAEQSDASQILVYDVTADELLYSKGVPGGKLYPASTTKLFSAYVALGVLTPETVLTAGDELGLVKSGSSVAYIAEGNQLTVEMLVEAMLLPSGNDAAMVLAAGAGRVIADDDGLSGSEAVRVFVEQMNTTAAELGFEKSHFANPDGYHTGSHYTCLDDMIRIAKLALDNQIISKYMALESDEVVYASGHTMSWTNTNRLLNGESEYYCSEAIGMKTGHTSQAGYCLMSAFERNGRTVVIGIFGCTESASRFQSVLQLLDACC